MGETFSFSGVVFILNTSFTTELKAQFAKTDYSSTTRKLVIGITLPETKGLKCNCLECSWGSLSYRLGIGTYDTGLLF